MKSFLKYTLATIVGIVILNIAGFLLFLMIFAISSGSDTPDVKENSVLVAKFSSQITDRSNDNPFSQFITGNLDLESGMGLNQILKDIKKAKTDDDISGIFLKLTSIQASIATVEEIRDALLDFKESGKYIIAHADSYSHKTYYLASVADKIYMTPTGNLTFSGLAAQVTFFKKALDKLGVEVQVVRHGSYKSAVEPFIKEKMSPENREQMHVLISDVWDQMVQEISASRNIPVETLNEYANKLAVSSDKEALDKGMIDGLKYYDEVLDELRERTGTEKDDDIPSVSLKKYEDVPASVKLVPTRDKIAVIYAMGTVVSGEAQEGMIGSDRIARAIRKAREDKNVKAIVFRVNSGGGSTIASEVIYREMKLAAEQKPVVASLGDVAASGGYYIVCPADTILASETTITGSIGVFGMIPNLQKLLNEKLGITTDVVKTNTYSDLITTDKPMDPYVREQLQTSVDDIYDTFIHHVAEGRGMTPEQVDAIGGGRVWSGKDALRIGLIDMYGGLEKSIKVAAEMAGLDNYRVTSLPALEDPFTTIMKQLSGEVKVKMIRKELGDTYYVYRDLKNIQQMKGVQALMPYTIYMH